MSDHNKQMEEIQKQIRKTNKKTMESLNEVIQHQNDIIDRLEGKKYNSETEKQELLKYYNINTTLLKELKEIYSGKNNVLSQKNSNSINNVLSQKSLDLDFDKNSIKTMKLTSPTYNANLINKDKINSINGSKIFYIAVFFVALALVKNYLL